MGNTRPVVCRQTLENRDGRREFSSSMVANIRANCAKKNGYPIRTSRRGTGQLGTKAFRRCEPVVGSRVERALGRRKARPLFVARLPAWRGELFLVG